ncbi:MAG: alpha/beta hydrolase [Actinomycetaceae bacterium]|nr:alpha/beta hydrolase [Actinomycetaceae bacterium]
MTKRRVQTRRRAHSPFYGLRRVPQAYAPRYARARVIPLAPALVLAAGATIAAGSPLIPPPLRPLIADKATRLSAEVNDRSQKLFFDQPGLDTLVVRSAARVAGQVARAGRAWLCLQARLGRPQNAARAAEMIPLLPSRGYDALMTLILTMGTATGLLRGGPVSSRVIYDSARDGMRMPHVSGETRKPQVRHLRPPKTLGDMASDIDDLYWAMMRGQCVKVTRVGQGRHRRWIMALPGTDHFGLPSNPNPADIESNVREALGLPSGIRIGVLSALHAAMDADGIPLEQRSRERVFIAGHSQGGMIGVAFASENPEEAGVNVVGLLTMGAPARRRRIRPDVTMIAIEHDQDVVPSMDGAPGRAPDHRVVVGRRLVRPRHFPLNYAHSSSTYNETVHLLDRKVDIAPWGRLGEAARKLREFFPERDEESRVTIHEVWQEVLEPTQADTWDTFISLDRPEWEPVEYDLEWAPGGGAMKPEHMEGGKNNG